MILDWAHPHSHLVCDLSRPLLVQLRILDATIIVPLIVLEFLHLRPYTEWSLNSALKAYVLPHGNEPKAVLTTLSALIFLEQQNAGGRQPWVQWGGVGPGARSRNATCPFSLHLLA